MPQKNTIWGVGPKLLIVTVAYFCLVIAADAHLAPAARITAQPAWLNAAAAVLLAAGIVIWIIAVRTIFLMYKQEHLYRQGLYAYCRHPLYANFILTVVPGFCLLFNSWLVITTPVFMYFAFKVLIRAEEQGLIDSFGAAYIKYKMEVNAVFPKLCSTRHH